MASGAILTASEARGVANNAIDSATRALVGIAKTVLGIGALILVHELGHFLVGRWCGVKAAVSR